LLAEPPDTAHGCAQHGMATARFTSNGRAVLYFFQKLLLCWEYIHISSVDRFYWNRFETFSGAHAVLPFFRACLFIPVHKQFASTLALTVGQLTLNGCAVRDSLDP